MKVKAFSTGDVALGQPWREDIPEDVAVDQFSSMYSNTLLISGKVVALTGFQVMSKTSARVCMLVNDRVVGHGKQLTEIVSSILDFHVAHFRTKKAYALIDSEVEVNIHWIKRLGFTEEYRMLKAGDNDQDMIGYVKTFKKEE